MRAQVEARLLGDRQAWLTAAFMAGASLDGVPDVDQALADWETRLATEPQPDEEDLIRQLMRELEVA